MVGIFILFFGVLFFEIKNIQAAPIFKKKLFSYEKKNFHASRIIDEFHITVISILLSTNLISVWRAFPIGWDDSGAYMNYPKLLSQSHDLLAFGKMYVWELYTSVGYILGSQSFAFLLNTFSGFVVIFLLVLLFRTIFPKKTENYDLGLFFSAILLSLPMTVFQLAKDMKLDYGLLALSIIAFSIFFSWYQNHTNLKARAEYKILFLVGLFLGFVFSLKLTSLLLIIMTFSLLFYSFLGIIGFLSFMGIFIGIFTLGNLWSMMNVVVPSGIFSQIFALCCIVFSLG